MTDRTGKLRYIAVAGFFEQDVPTGPHDTACNFSLLPSSCLSLGAFR